MGLKGNDPLDGRCDETLQIDEDTKDQLLNGPNPNAYRTLSECLLSEIILCNGRRQGEVAKMLVVAYRRNRSMQELNNDVVLCLPNFEQDLSQAFTQLVIRGKRGRNVPVFLTREMTESLNFLLKKKGEKMGFQIPMNMFLPEKPEMRGLDS